MFVMKRAAVPVSVAMFAILFLAGSIAARGEPRPAHRFANPLLDDVVAMTQAQVPDATILAFLRVRRARLESDITAEDLVALRDAPAFSIGRDWAVDLPGGAVARSAVHAITARRCVSHETIPSPPFRQADEAPDTHSRAPMHWRALSYIRTRTGC